MRVRYDYSSRRTGRILGINDHKKPVPTIVREVIKISDIILEILDARFIDETRNKEMENLIKEEEKGIIYVLNKMDLTSKEDVEIKLSEKNLFPYVLISCKKRSGITDLRNRIKIEVKKLGLKKKKGYERAQVGIIGYPNTGKSSLINVLGGAGTRTSAEAGFTKGMQRIRLTKGILLIDTPGVFQDKENSTDNKIYLKKHAKIGMRTYDKVKDPEFLVYEMIKKDAKEFEIFYKIKCDNIEEFLDNLGRKNGFLKKGNVVDLDRTARLILKDYQQGKLKI